MILFLTLFGGMALTAVLYGLGRLAKLSNFWASVTACGIPVFAYLGWAFITQPTLDAITLHVIAYPTVSVLLFQLYDQRRQGRVNAPLHWAPLMMVGLFVVLTVIMGSFVYISKEGLPPALAQMLLPGNHKVHTGFAGVVAHQEEAAKTIAHRRRMDDRLQKLGWQIEISGLEHASINKPLALAVILRDRNGAPLPQATVRFALARPGAKPEWISLPEVHPGRFEQQLPAVTAGTWVAFITLASGAEKINLERDLAW
jgi:hypothetical protein